MQAEAEFLVLDEPVRPVGETGLTAQTGLTGSSINKANSAMKDDLIIKAEDQNWRVPLIFYLKNSGRGAEKNTWRMAFK